MGIARAKPRLARGGASSQREGDGGHCRRYAHAIFTRAVSRSQSGPPTRSAERRGYDSLCPPAAGRDGDPRNNRDSYARDFMAVAVFVDKDGTLVENIPYNVDPM